MKVEFTKRAIRDLHDISDYSRRHFGNRVTAALERRIRAAISNIGHAPESAPRIEQLPGMRVVALVRYPFSVFYRIVDDTVRIVHIRHAARRPWDGVEANEP
jgi:plasmid stabilization system protein ParE